MTFKEKLNQILSKDIYKKSLSTHVNEAKFFAALESYAWQENNQPLFLSDRLKIVVGNSIREAAQLGLLFGKECSLNEKNGKLTIDYKGLLKIAYRNKNILKITTEIVYDKDKFRVRYTNCEASLDHEINPVRGKMIGAYAIATIQDTGYIVEYMSDTEIKPHEQMSKSNAWSKWKTEMWKKTVLRRLCKRLPHNEELIDLIDIEDANYKEIETTNYKELPEKSQDLETAMGIKKDDVPNN